MSKTVVCSKSSALEKMRGKIDDLPLLPQVLVKLMQLDRASEDYFDEFEILVKEDPTFAVRVVALANSASSAPASPITSIRDAVTRMGAVTISSLVASLAVQRVFMPSKPGEVKLWTHSVLAATATERIAKLAKGLELDAGQAYLAGLLHDIGRFVMLEHASDELQQVDESNWQTPDELVAADVEVYKYTHCELGFLACERWGIPDVVSSVVRNHHADLAPSIRPGSAEALTYCVQVADRLCILVLEHDHDEECPELIEKISNDCIIDIDDNGPDARDLLAEISTIKEASNSLLKGLGL